MSNMMTVLPGDTLDTLSARLGVPGCMILRANGMSPYDMREGAMFLSPTINFCHDKGPCPMLTQAQGSGIYVADGENIFSAALRAGTTVRLLMVENDLESPTVHNGQFLKVPEKPDGVVTHTVQGAEALPDIASTYSVSALELAHINRLSGNTPLYPGQRLLIPA